jgi:deazaflavin-dependent oxidoreductase (nitroreductase family)
MTTMSTERPPNPEQMARMARRMRLANVPMRFLLGLPFPTPLSSRLMLVTHTGRKTGRRYRQPVSYVRDGDVLLTPGGGRWTDNLRDGEPVPVRLRGRDVVARPDLVRDPDEVDRLLRRMYERSSSVARFIPFMGPDGTIDRTKLETALRFGFRVVRWRVD